MLGIVDVRHWIGGSWHTSTQAIDDVNPATGQVIARVPLGTTLDVDTAVAAATRAFPAWAARSAEERARFLERVADAIEARTDELALIESRDTGKPITLARQLDVPRAVANFRFFAALVRTWESESHHTPTALNYTLREPLGVVGLITPWNLPLYLLTWKLAPALAMGNTVVAKPSELAPLTAQVLGEILAGAGCPDGVVHIVHGRAEAGSALVRDPVVRAISFTGGTETGRRVAVDAAPSFKKLSLELGGKNATLVFDDCDFERAVASAVRSGFLNQGQLCLCGSRVLVQRGIAEKFTQALVTGAQALRVGDPEELSTEVGAVISSAHRERVESFIARARSDGAQVRCGGARPMLVAPHDRGFFLLPTIISDLEAKSPLLCEEIFGPVVTVSVFDTEEEALALANGSRFGLSASVWTSNLKRGHRLSAGMEVGMVWVNCWLVRDLRVPFGGVKDSGVGREGGRHSLEFFSEAKNVCVEI